MEDLQDVGNSGQKIIAKCDQEPAIVDLQMEVGKARGAPTMPTNSSAGDSEGNGRIENTIQRAQNQFRRLLCNLQSKSEFTLIVDHPLFDWILEWSAGILNRYVKGTDGRSACGRVRGYETSRDIAEFGERVMYAL